MPSCPICRGPVAPRSANRSFPFCSDRCKLLDLGKWLGEDYRIPGPRMGDGAERPTTDPRDPEAPDAGETD